MIDIYQRRTADFEAQATQLHSLFNRVAWLRVGVFLTGIALTWVTYQAVNPWLAVGIGLAFTVLFFATLQWHNRIAYQRNHARFLAQINREEVQRLQGKYQPAYTGQPFADPHHPYTGDLDIFGPHSLFVLLNRCQTAVGGEMLARWLQKAAPADEIPVRQTAVAELAAALDWRQQLQATGRHHPDNPAHARLISDWLDAPPTRLHTNRWLVVATYALPLLMAAAIGLAVFDESVTYHLPMAVALLNIGVVGLVNKRVKHLTEQAYETSKPLRGYADLLRLVEQHPFRAEKLIALKAALASEGNRASEKIEQLSGISGNLMAAHNPYFGLLANGLVLWNLYWAIRLERWKAKTQTDLPRWLDALAETEALCSLAGFAHTAPSQPPPKGEEQKLPPLGGGSGWGFPVLREEPGGSLFFSARNLGHPLILREKRVLNDFTLVGTGRTGIVTGSNMSGKSTFLRTVGINAVLAFAGAPVCATEMQLSHFRVFTSMRTQDSLEESVSSFYAEL
ncbi:MAG: hypothetical protein MUD08_16075, partial [Cytophagales bacterium]|nr:hypothetical protein [Cytophagales bacterium]